MARTDNVRCGTQFQLLTSIESHFEHGSIGIQQTEFTAPQKPPEIGQDVLAA